MNVSPRGMMNAASPVAFPASNNIPLEFICPILNQVMTDPVFATATGLNFERWAIESWCCLHGSICPLTGRRMGSLIPNPILRERINIWRRVAFDIQKIEQQRKSAARITKADSVVNRGDTFVPENRPVNQRSSNASFTASQKELKGHSVDKETVQPVDDQKFAHVVSLVQAITSKISEADMAKYADQSESKMSQIQR